MTLPITPVLATDLRPLLRSTSCAPGHWTRVLQRSCVPVFVLLLPVLCVAGISGSAGFQARVLVALIPVALLFGSAPIIPCLNTVLACDARQREGGNAAYSPQKVRRKR